MIMKGKMLLTLFFMLMASSFAEAAQYTFRQGGFNEGGIITGSFEARDTVGGFDNNGNDAPDGIICIIFSGCNGPKDDEITKFSIHFSGNSFFDSFNSLQETGLRAFNFDLQNGNLQLGYGSGRGCCIVDPGFFTYNGYTTGRGEVSLVGDRVEEHRWGTREPLVVSQVPLPGASGLFLAGLAWLFGSFRRKAVL